MANYRIEWHGPKVLREATAVNLSALQKAVALVVSSAKGIFRTRPKRKHRRKSATSKNLTRSKGPPTIRTGLLQKSIFGQIKQMGTNKTFLQARVGPDVEMLSGTRGFHKPTNPSHYNFYGYWVEMGTKTAAPHPFLRPAMRMNQKKIKQIFVETNS